jgi:hypothetical protein
MPKNPKTPVDPALLPLINALARLAVADQERETTEAAPEIAELRSVLELEGDFSAWKRRSEGLMKEFYRRVPLWSSMPLKERLRLVTAAVRHLGRDATDRRIVTWASKLAEQEHAASVQARRGTARTRRGSDSRP